MRIVNLPTTRATILVIEESPALSELIELILARSGYHVLGAQNQESALMIARETPSIDLVLRGIDLPDNCRDFESDFSNYHPAGSIAYLVNSTDELPTHFPTESLQMPFSASDLRAFVCRSLSPTFRTSAETAHAA